MVLPILIIIGIIVITLIVLMAVALPFVKLGIMVIALAFIYKKFPASKNMSNLQLTMLGIITFIALAILGKSIGAFAVSDLPKAVQPVAQFQFTPLNGILLFIIGVLAILYMNKIEKLR